MIIKYKTIIVLILIYILIFPIFAKENQSIQKPITYKILTDQNYGFFRTYIMDGSKFGKEIFTENNTLNISEGDSITILSDTMPDKLLTIISEEKLWNDKILKQSGKEFTYVFNKSGVYNLHIKERPLLKEKIIVLSNHSENKTNESVIKKSISNKTNKTTSNPMIKPKRLNTTVVSQNTTNNRSNSPIISISLTDGLRSKIRSGSDTLIFSVILIGIYILSGRIKD